MRSIDVSAKSRELAITNALAQLGVDRDEVYVEILDEGSKGLFGLGARPVKLRVSTEVPGPEPVSSRPAPARRQEPDQQPQRQQRPQPQRQDSQRPPQQRQQQPSRQQQPQRGQQPQRPAQAPRREHAPRPAPAPRPPAAPRPASAGPIDAEAEALLREVFQRMGIEATVAGESGENGEVILKVTSPDSAILIGRKGRSLGAIQYLINRMVNRNDAEEGEHITIDVEGYLGRRQEALEDLASRLAARAKESGRRQRTKPMSPQERRIIHVALEADSEVRTFSLGDANARFVVVAPKDERAGAGEDRPPRERGRRGGRGRGPQGDRGDRPARPFQQSASESGVGESANHVPADGTSEGSNGEHSQRPEGVNEDRGRRRSRRGRRGRGGPRPDAAPQPDAAASEPQES